MPKIDIFLDSSALMAGILSESGASPALLLLCEDERVLLTVTEQVIAEVERNLARKAPKLLPLAREMILRSNLRILRDPSLEEVRAHLDWIGHPADVPILVAAKQANVDFLATLNVHHFIDDPDVSKRSGLRIATPREVLIRVRDELAKW